MAHVQFIDELIKEYLLYRGFSATVKTFDTELKSEKEKGFRVDKIVDQLMQHIYSNDLNALRELWNHLDNHMFSKLESNFTPSVRKLENAVLKMYLVNAVINNKPEKIVEFFVKMTPELQNQNEWKDWFILPYVKNPEDNPTFSVHFTRQWQDTLLVSLHNFLSTIFQYMPQPTLMQYDDKLRKENEDLKNRLSILNECSQGNELTPCDIAAPEDLPDDFFIIAQENSTIDNQPRGLKSFIRNIGTGSSPILGRKDNFNQNKKRGSSVSGKSTHTSKDFS